jgi:hypothetical protein
MNIDRKVGALVACLAVSGLLAACGSSASSSSSSAQAVASAGTSRFAADRAKLAACLKQHGVTLPSRPGGGLRHRFTPGGGFFGGHARSDPKLQAAFKACASDFPRGGFAFRGAARQTAVIKFVTCVRQHGYDLPKPNFSGNGPVFPSNIQSNPRFRAASKSCARLLVGRGARPPGAARPQGTGQPSA